MRTNRIKAGASKAVSQPPPVPGRQTQFSAACPTPHRLARCRRRADRKGWGCCGELGAAGAGAGAGVAAALPVSADFNAPSTSCAQWIFIGGSGPSGAASSCPLIASASAAVLPRINSVAMLATAIAVWQPNVWNVARSMTFRPPSSSLNFTHIRSMSPQSGLPTVPTASAFSISPRFCGFSRAASMRASKSVGCSLMKVGNISRRGAEAQRISEVWGLPLFFAQVFLVHSKW